MNSPVVVGFDGSAAAHAAVRHGARQAQRPTANCGSCTRSPRSYCWLRCIRRTRGLPGHHRAVPRRITPCNAQCGHKIETDRMRDRPTTRWCTVCQI
jgi:hypothetical protein